MRIRIPGGWLRPHHARPGPTTWLTAPKALVLGFAVIIALGTVLLSLPAASAGGQPLPWLDAFFTAASAACVTGLTVVDTGTRFSPFGQAVILLLMQIGGVGFVTMAVVISVLIGRTVSLRERLLAQEALGHIKFQGMVRLALSILLFALAAEAVGAILLWARWRADLGPGQAAWFAAFHAVSAFVNAGFDLFGAQGQASLHGYRSDLLVNAVIGGLIALGSLGLPVLYEIAQWRRARRFSLHAHLVLSVSALLWLGGAAALLLTESESASAIQQLPLGERLLVALFHSVSARTGGLSTVSIVALSHAGWFVLMALMFVGAATASMGGGLKVNVLGALLATLWSVARGREAVQAFERTIPRETVYKALAVMMGSATLVMVMTILLNLAERGDPLRLMFEVVSAFGTVGFSLGATPHLSPAGKLIVIATMFVGRLGPLTLVAALARRPAPQLLRYPEERILIG
jgi:trk system potassium uptake protein TrkH